MGAWAATMCRTDLQKSFVKYGCLGTHDERTVNKQQSLKIIFSVQCGCVHTHAFQETKLKLYHMGVCTVHPYFLYRQYQSHPVRYSVGVCTPILLMSQYRANPFCEHTHTVKRGIFTGSCVKRMKPYGT